MKKKPTPPFDLSHAAVLRSFNKGLDGQWGWQAAVWPTYGWRASFWIKSTGTFRTQREAQEDCQKQLDILGLGKAKAPPS